MSNTAKNFFNPFEAFSNMPNMVNLGAAERMREQANRNIQTLTSMNQVCAESFQAMARRSAEVMQKNAQQCMENARDASASKTPEDAQKATAAAMNSAVKECCGSARDAAEMGAKLFIKTIDMVDSMASETLKEWNECCHGASTQAKK